MSHLSSVKLFYFGNNYQVFGGFLEVHWISNNVDYKYSLNHCPFINTLHTTLFYNNEYNECGVILVLTM